MSEPVRFYFDEHVNPAIASGLRTRGIDAVTAGDVGRLGLSDSDHLSYATTEGRVVVTHDSDYIALHNIGTPHAGIAWSPALKYGIGQLVNELTLLHAVHAADEMVDRLEYL